MGNVFRHKYLTILDAGGKHRQKHNLWQSHLHDLWDVAVSLLSHQPPRSPTLNPDHIDKIIFYLRTSDNFKKYNKFVYAFRLEQAHNPTFVTEDRHAGGEKFIEGYNDDTGLQGNGEKLLNLLKKFSIYGLIQMCAMC